MSCARIRQGLMQSDGHQPVAAHLRHCAACRRFAERLQTTRQGLRRHHAGIEPDAAFAARVGRHLANDTPTNLGRTALRLLPLSAAVLLLLFLISTQTTPLPEPAATITTTEDAYLTWVLAADEENS
jgi:hypothetical protein